MTDLLSHVPVPPPPCMSPLPPQPASGGSEPRDFPLCILAVALPLWGRAPGRCAPRSPSALPAFVPCLCPLPVPGRLQCPAWGRLTPPLLLSADAFLAACAAQIRWPQFPQAGSLPAGAGPPGAGPRGRSRAALPAPTGSAFRPRAGQGKTALVVATRGARHPLKIHSVFAGRLTALPSSLLTRAPAGAVERLPGTGRIKLVSPFRIGYFLLLRSVVSF